MRFMKRKHIGFDFHHHEAMKLQNFHQHIAHDPLLSYGSAAGKVKILFVFYIESYVKPFEQATVSKRGLY